MFQFTIIKMFILIKSHNLDRYDFISTNKSCNHQTSLQFFDTPIITFTTLILIHRLFSFKDFYFTNTRLTTLANYQINNYLFRALDHGP